MTPQLFDEFNTFKQALQATAEAKSKTLTRMNNCVSYFDESYENADISRHIDCSKAVEIIDDAGNYSGTESYIKLYKQLLTILAEEQKVIKTMSKFLASMNLKITTTEQPCELNLEALAIRNGKIVTNQVGNV